jgi:hypothetical protein
MRYLSKALNTLTLRPSGAQQGGAGRSVMPASYPFCRGLLDIGSVVSGGNADFLHSVV